MRLRDSAPGIFRDEAGRPSRHRIIKKRDLTTPTHHLFSILFSPFVNDQRIVAGRGAHSSLGRPGSRWPMISPEASLSLSLEAHDLSHNKRTEGVTPSVKFQSREPQQDGQGKDGCISQGWSRWASLSADDGWGSWSTSFLFFWGFSFPPCNSKPHG